MVCNDCPFITIDDNGIYIIDDGILSDSIIDLFAVFSNFSITVVMRVGSTNRLATVTPKRQNFFTCVIVKLVQRWHGNWSKGV